MQRAKWILGSSFVIATASSGAVGQPADWERAGAFRGEVGLAAVDLAAVGIPVESHEALIEAIRDHFVAAAETIQAEPLLDRVFDPIGVRGRGPDIIGIGPGRGLQFEVTTNSLREILKHQARYGSRPTVVTYERPPGFQGFP